MQVTYFKPHQITRYRPNLALYIPVDIPKSNNPQTQRR